MKQVKRIQLVQPLPPKPLTVQAPPCDGRAVPISPLVRRRNYFTVVQFYKCEKCNAIRRRELFMTEVDSGTEQVSVAVRCATLQPVMGEYEIRK